jgi:NAD(P)H-hydrate repair Nnr-like enzyme with NAD(P)H-hydrate dehydratase domain
MPPPGSDKNRKGGVLIRRREPTTPGAVLHSAEAALRMGAGKVQLTTVRSTATAHAVAA